jgi:hypothetical protein
MISPPCAFINPAPNSTVCVSVCVSVRVSESHSYTHAQILATHAHADTHITDAHAHIHTRQVPIDKIVTIEKPVPVEKIREVPVEKVVRLPMCFGAELGLVSFRVVVYEPATCSIRLLPVMQYICNIRLMYV